MRDIRQRHRLSHPDPTSELDLKPSLLYSPPPLPSPRVFCHETVLERSCACTCLETSANET